MWEVVVGRGWCGGKRRWSGAASQWCGGESRGVNLMGVLIRVVEAVLRNYMGIHLSENAVQLVIWILLKLASEDEVFKKFHSARWCFD